MPALLEPPPHGTERRYRWDYRHGFEPCASCVGAFKRARDDRRVAKMTANVDNPNKRHLGGPTRRDHVAPAMVRGWDAEQRKRIRGILLALLLCYPLGTDLADTPEMRVVAMIDKEQACRPR